MTTFSDRYGYKKSEIQFEFASETFKNRIFAYFYHREFKLDGELDFSSIIPDKISGIERMMVEYGLVYEPPATNISKKRNAEKLQSAIVKSGEWYTIYDFIEKYLAIINEEQLAKVESDLNRILEEECAGYRIVNQLVVPITNETELSTIIDAKSTQYDSVNTHITKALSLYADRKKPDYENSIKESISAVESMCCIITGMTGAGATLGSALKKVKDNGVHIHKAMESAFSSLYGYTSDENGIRHGGIDFTNAPAEDAKFMLVSCSSFVNYLIEKWSKIK